MLARGTERRDLLETVQGYVILKAATFETGHHDLPPPSGPDHAAGADLPRVRDQQPHQVPQVICKNDKKCTKCGRQNGLISS